MTSSGKRLAALLGPDHQTQAELEEIVGEEAEGLQHSRELLAKARRLLDAAPPEDAEEIRQLIDDLESAAQAGSQERIQQVSEKLEDVLFYVEDV